MYFFKNILKYYLTWCAMHVKAFSNLKNEGRQTLNKIILRKKKKGKFLIGIYFKNNNETKRK